jgi:hypothetical protein
MAGGEEVNRAVAAAKDALPAWEGCPSRSVVTCCCGWPHDRRGAEDITRLVAMGMGALKIFAGTPR